MSSTPKTMSLVSAISMKDASNAIPSTNWGRRREAGWGAAMGSFLLVAFCPVWVLINWIALEHYQGSLTSTVDAALKSGLVAFLRGHLPAPSVSALVGYVLWLTLQAALYRFLPGKPCNGQQTPRGNVLVYYTNGLLIWCVVHVLYFLVSFFNILDPAIIANNWEGLLVAVNFFGFLFAFLAQVKGHWAPSSLERSFSGSLIYDFFMGVELNPRLGPFWDFKFFFNGRPGLLAWTLVDLSWAAYQFQRLGHVSASMKILITLHSIYALDFFYNEDWYVRTIDITHDHFGFYFAWGDTTLVPTLYTIQAQYLARYPSYLTNSQVVTTLLVGGLGYALFRAANHQKDLVRKTRGNCRIWGKRAQFIECSYQTCDGETHQSLLLTSGWWGTARHCNYFADLVQAWAMCATCGFENLLPWSYFLFMVAVLWHRIGRDERRCSIKYGKAWEEYCRRVPFRLIPGVL